VKIIVRAIGIFLMFSALISCTNFTSTPAANPTNIVETQTPRPASTPSIETQLALITPTDISNPTAAPDQQVYTDPHGWYSVFFPADMQPTDKPNVFSWMGDFFETGYLSELGYMSNVINVCAWLANIELEPGQSAVDWGAVFQANFQSEPRCSVSTKGISEEATKYDVFEIPAADPEHRFVYIKISWSSYNAMVGNKRPAAFLSWLKPITPRQELLLGPLSDEELSRWKQTAPLLESASVTEYALPAGSDPGEQANLLRELPENALPDWFTNRLDLPTPTKTPTVEEQLEPLGYEKRTVTNDTGAPLYYQLYRDGKLLFDYVYNVSEVYKYSTDSGPVTAFTVNTAGTQGNYHNSFLILNDAIHTWEFNNQDPRFNPILYQNEILWLKATKGFGQVQIVKSNQEAIYSFAAYTEPTYAVNRFLTWNGHWVLAARDFLIQDGEILNETLSFEEIFSWSLIEEKPLYLFRKGPRISISYDGKILPLEYQDVARYWCCGFSANNPAVDSNGAHFFGKRNGVWFYVVVDVR
jgi:hypothetical protein